jgi:hypothetical protein
MVSIKKISIILLLFAVLLCAELSYANVDPAANLSNWYDQLFQKESDEIGAATTSGVWTTFEQAEVFMLETKKTIDYSLESVRNKQSQKAKNGIEKNLMELKNQLDNAVSELKKENFDDYAENANVEEVIEPDIQSILEEVLGDLNK